MFEINARDAGGRICGWKFGKYTVNTPQIAIVINPNHQIIPPNELKKKFGAEIVITNAYIAKKSKNSDEIMKKGLHRYFKWRGPVYTDSGTYQMYSKGSVTITPEETLEFQKRTGSDIITPLDLFTTPADSFDVAKHKLDETIERIKVARETVDNNQLSGPVQGGAYLDLRRRAASLVSKSGADIYAIGGIVPLMNQYRFAELLNIIMTSKMYLSPEKPVHAFGCGHPMVFSLLVAAGIDLFDSAAYAIYAKDNRYMTERGTENVRELRELPCECPVCSRYSAREFDEKLLAEHNLYQTFKEIRTIRHAIYEGTLWELVEQRIRAHPLLIGAYRQMSKYNRYLETVEPITRKKAFFETGRESLNRPEIYRVKQRVKRMNCPETVRWDGINVPRGLLQTYPVGQSVLIEKKKTEKTAGPRETVTDVLRYQYGEGAEMMMTDDTEIEISKSTGRIRRVHRGGKVLGTVRANDGLFIPTIAGAEELMKVLKKGAYTVKISDDAVPFVKERKSVFSKFVTGACSDIRPGDEVFVTDARGTLVAVGTACLNRGEMEHFRDGVAVRIRHANI